MILSIRWAARSAAGLLAAALGLTGCDDGPSIENLCERIATCEATTIAEEQAVLDECLDEGDLVAEQAYDDGCDGELSDYLDCIDEYECDWWYECEDEQDELVSCMGSLPQD